MGRLEFVRSSPRPRAYALLSGGKDSMTLAHVLTLADSLIACVAFDTGISVPEWRPFIEETCQKQGWPLIMLRAEDSRFLGGAITYEALVRRFGFPGPGLHGYFMTYLKGRCLAQFRKEHPGVLVASGVRQGESRRRFRNTKEWSVMEGQPLWAALYDWTTPEVWDYVRVHNLTRSPAYTTLGISGDCLCGAFAQSHEREVIRDVYPTVDARLVSLEKEVEGVWGCGKARRGATSIAERAICVECAPSGDPQEGTR